MSRTAAKPDKHTTSPSTPRSSRARLAAALTLAVCGLSLLVYRIYQTVSAPAKPAQGSLSADTPLAPPPPIPNDDRQKTADRLQKLEALRAALRAQPENLALAREAAQKALRAGDPLMAELACRAALARAHPPAPELFALRGRAEMLLGLVALAERDYREVTQRAPEEAAGFLGLSHALSAQERRAEAAQVMERAAQAVPQSRPAERWKLVEEWERQGDLPRALQEAQTLPADNPDDAVTTARLLYKLSRFSEAQRLLAPLVAAHPENSAAHYYLAAILSDPLNPQRDIAAAEPMLLEAARANPQVVTPLLRLGELTQEQGRYRDSALVYGQILQAEPDSGTARLRLSLAYARLGDKNAAQEQNRLAQKLLARDRDEARLLTRRDQRPADPQIHRLLADHYQKEGQFARALVERQAAYRLAPGAPEVRRELLALYREIGAAPPELLGEPRP